MARRSPSKCWNCASESVALPFCESCGKLQGLPDGLSHFEVLGLEPSLDVEDSTLRERFYALSRKSHPDMFATVPPPESSHAMSWSTAINKAYQTLRDPLKRSQYVLELNGIEEKKSEIPLELAETYFELQDADDANLPKFRDELLQMEDSDFSEWKQIAKANDLPKLRSYLTKRKYLSSMIADLDKRLGISSDRRH